MSREVQLDHQRGQRIGLSEAVMCQGKHVGQLQSIVAEVESAALPMLFTRLDADVAARLSIERGSWDYEAVSRTAIYLPPDHAAQIQEHPALAIVSAGSADVPVAREASRTLAFHGLGAPLIFDVGVAGPWRLQARLDELRQKKIIICVAGMDAALPTVLAAQVPGLVIAVPTSVGYGMARQGETALHASLCSCAQGLVVVNIDNGFGAACAALRALGKAR